MDTYTFLREVAGGWVLVLMVAFFVAMIVWVLAGRRSSYRDTAAIIFRHEDKPPSEAISGASGDGGKEVQS